MSYAEFLRSKATVARLDGFEIDPAQINPILKPHQRKLVEWAA